MGRLLKRPEGFWGGLLKGAGWTAALIAVPVALRTVGIAVFESGLTWTDFAWGSAVPVTAILIGGIVGAVRGALRRWAYDRLTGHPFK